MTPIEPNPTPKIESRAAAEGRAIKIANGYRLLKPKQPKKSRLRYGHPPKREKKPGQLRLDRPILDYDVPDYLKAILDADAYREAHRYDLS